jgi:hypothetical protein
VLGIRAAAAYAGTSTWTLRRLVKTGWLSPVVIPVGTKGPVERLLFDRRDLDRLIDRWKAPTAR